MFFRRNVRLMVLRDEGHRRRIQHAVSDRLAQDKTPKNYAFVDMLPRTSMEKLPKFRLCVT